MIKNVTKNVDSTEKKTHLCTEFNNDESVPVVLVVDDEPEVLNFLRLILSGTYRVVTQHSATDAIANLPQLKPDLIVSDVMMLGMDSLKFCQLLKEDIAYCHIPVILLTAKVSLEERSRASMSVPMPMSPSRSSLPLAGTHQESARQPPAHPAHALDQYFRW